MHLYKRFCPSVGPSVRPSVGPSVTPVQKPRFSAVFGHGKILNWNKWSTKRFWEPPLLLSRFTRLFVHLSLHICCMINRRRDTVRTHRCQFGLVLTAQKIEFWKIKKRIQVLFTQNFLSKFKKVFRVVRDIRRISGDSGAFGYHRRWLLGILEKKSQTRKKKRKNEFRQSLEHHRCRRDRLFTHQRQKVCK